MTMHHGPGSSMRAPTRLDAAPAQAANPWLPVISFLVAAGISLPACGDQE